MGHQFQPTCNLIVRQLKWCTKRVTTESAYLDASADPLRPGSYSTPDGPRLHYQGCPKIGIRLL